MKVEEGDGEAFFQQADAEGDDGFFAKGWEEIRKKKWPEDVPGVSFSHAGEDVAEEDEYSKSEDEGYEKFYQSEGEGWFLVHGCMGPASCWVLMCVSEYCYGCMVMAAWSFS